MSLDTAKSDLSTEAQVVGTEQNNDQTAPNFVSSTETDDSHNVLVLNNGSRLLCIADLRGELSLINKLAEETRADCVIHTGDFGFFERSSLPNISERTLRHIVQFSPLIKRLPRSKSFDHYPSNPISDLKNSIASHPDCLLSELPYFLSQERKFIVPVYTVWGASEDVHVLEKFATGEYSIPNLNIIDELHSHLLQIGDLKIRLLGLGGPYVPFKLFDNGEGKGTIAGAQGTTWTTVLQMGELIETAKSCLDREETRVFITHHPIGREGVFCQLATVLQADITLSAGLHFRYGASYNEFSVNPNPEHYLQKLSAGRAQFMEVWETVKSEVERMVTPDQQHLVNNVTRLVSRMPDATNSYAMNNMLPGTALKNLWNFNLLDASFGWNVLVVENGHVQVESKSFGFNLGYRRSAARRNDNYNRVTEGGSTGENYYRPQKSEAQARPSFAAEVETAGKQNSEPVVEEAKAAVEPDEPLKKDEAHPDQSLPKETVYEEDESVSASKLPSDAKDIEKGLADTTISEESTIDEKDAAERIPGEQSGSTVYARQTPKGDYQKNMDRGFRPNYGERQERFGFHITPCNTEEEARSFFTDGADQLITNVQIRTSTNRNRNLPPNTNVTPTNYAYVHFENQDAVNKVADKIKTPDGVRANVMRDDYYRQNRGWYRGGRTEGHYSNMRTNRGRGGRGGRYPRMQQHPRQMQSAGTSVAPNYSTEQSSADH
ncbi:DUF2433 metallo phosphatase superfamily conserved fungal protein [Schizosaccharomyces osmophilus]|uniref:DUF2433 metallo phosphatase superfamily conserved fungal protein n=1 Tax=Schizosaccharomyces osmophilus TaxID=2545709 RepID=A0AAE9W9B9_9SCHI|nr:DUF2433 metallo phosphatase superfamily conserved fungal protein [Schizosaccharomyces osmophilus]WBW72060.1 DUF2433 metallo phosphatase superfamily conserved fungal protein [Schizosaccharomyces osmophilus]